MNQPTRASSATRRLQGPEGLRRALDYFIGEQGVPAEKVSLGLGLYGRSWTLDSPDNSGLGAPAGAAGAPGNCTGGCSAGRWMHPPRPCRAVLGAQGLGRVHQCPSS